MIKQSVSEIVDYGVEISIYIYIYIIGMKGWKARKGLVERKVGKS